VRFRSIVVAMLAMAAGMLATADAASAQCVRITPQRSGEVFFMRGLANIFSLGLDAFGREISAAGIENCVFNHGQWQNVVNDLAARNRRGQVSFPVIIIGHSLGANIAPQMATAIGRHGIPVAYVVMLDPVEATVVGGNVEEIVNYFLPRERDTLVHPGRYFTGRLENVDVRKFGRVDHFNIDRNRQLRDVIMRRILDLSTPRRR